MTRITRKPLAVAIAVGLVGGALVAPSIAPAKKTTKFKILMTSKITGTTLGGKVTGGTFGKGTVSGVNAPPKITAIWHLKGGTITAKTTDGHLVGAQIAGTFKITKGTGKFKGIKGKGKITGPLATLKLVYSGTATY